MKKPDHAAVVAAAGATGDRELIGLVADETSYVVKSLKNERLKNHVLFKVLLDLDHPVSLLMARTCDGKKTLRFTGGRLNDVHAILAAEPDLFASDALLTTFHELYRNRFGRSNVLEAPSARTSRRAGIATLTFAVQLPHRAEIWTVVLPPPGSTPTMKTEPLDPPRPGVSR